MMLLMTAFPSSYHHQPSHHHPCHHMIMRMIIMALWPSYHHHLIIILHWYHLFRKHWQQHCIWWLWFVLLTLTTFAQAMTSALHVIVSIWSAPCHDAQNIKRTRPMTPRRPQDGLERPQEDAKMAPRWPQDSNQCGCKTRFVVCEEQIQFYTTLFLICCLQYVLGCVTQ